MMLRVLIADDEAMARRRLERLLGDLGGVEITASCPDGPSALAAAAATLPDLALLDIDMPGLSGVELARQLPAGTAVIFTTAHPEHAVTAFDDGVVDYVLKPIEAGRLALALRRVELRRREAPGVVPIPTPSGIVLLPSTCLLAVSIDGLSTRVDSDRGVWFSDWPLTEFERRVAGLHRVHRTALVRLERVARLRPTDGGGYDAILESGHAISVSRSAARDLRKRLGLRG